MDSNQTINLAGTSWVLSQDGSTLGVLTFNNGTMGTYHPQGESSEAVFWWQHNNSFWAQEKAERSSYLSIIEGELTSDSTGNGRIVVGQDQGGMILVENFTMAPS